MILVTWDIYRHLHIFRACTVVFNVEVINVF
jgi:hypothetical protein